jgi:hypothetical protein
MTKAMSKQSDMSRITIYSYSRIPRFVHRQRVAKLWVWCVGRRKTKFLWGKASHGMVLCLLGNSLENCPTIPKGKEGITPLGRRL